MVIDGGGAGEGDGGGSVVIDGGGTSEESDGEPKPKKIFFNTPSGTVSHVSEMLCMCSVI